MADGINWGSLGTGMVGGDLASALMAMFGNRFKNPAQAGMPFLNQIGDVLKQYLGPYNQAGVNALGTAQGQYGNLISNPTDEMNKIGATYQESPGYQFGLKEAERAATNAAAAGGMSGSPEAQQNAADIAENMANRDYNQYLNTGLNLYGQGLSGEQNIASMGEQAGGQLAEDLAQQLMSEANMAYAGTQNENEHQGGKWGNIGSLIKNAFLGAGFAGWL